MHGKNGIPKRVNVHRYDPILGGVKDTSIVDADTNHKRPHKGTLILFNIIRITT